MHETAQSIGAERTVATPLHQHGQDIIQTMQARLAANNWELFHQYSLIGDSTGQILIRGFGLPDRRGAAHSRIVMLLSPHTSYVGADTGHREPRDARGEASH